MIYPPNIELKDLPLWSIEAKYKDGSWERVKKFPFKTKGEAEQFINHKLDEGSWLILPENIRPCEYTAEQWRDDLIDLFLDDEDCITDLVEATDTETLLTIIKKTRIE